MRSLLGIAMLGFLVAGCAGSAGVVSNAPPIVSATPVATETPVTTNTPAPPPASATISTWTRLPASEAFQAATMDRVVAGPAGVLALGGRDDAAGGGFAGWWSSDGFAWTRSDATGTNFAGDGVALADGFVIVGKTGDNPGAESAMTWRSPDGTGWSGSPVDSLRTGPFAAAWIEDRLVLFAIRAPSGGEPTMAWSSDDLVSWTSGLLGGGGYSTARGLSVLADGSGLAFGSWSTEPQDAAPFPGPAGFWRSTDGRTWQKMADDADLRNAWVIGVAQAPGGPIVAVGQRWNPNLSPDQPYTNAAWTSPDGSAWDRATWPSSLERVSRPRRGSDRQRRNRSHRPFGGWPDVDRDRPADRLRRWAGQRPGGGGRPSRRRRRDGPAGGHGGRCRGLDRTGDRRITTGRRVVASRPGYAARA
jgi:hypothetical protein